MIDLPTVLPPAVAGLALLMAFGRRGLLGGLLATVGIALPFTTGAVVMAQTFVAAPFYVRGARVGFAAVDRRLERLAATLGVDPGFPTVHFVAVYPGDDGHLRAGRRAPFGPLDLQHGRDPIAGTVAVAQEADLTLQPGGPIGADVERPLCRGVPLCRMSHLDRVLTA